MIKTPDNRHLELRLGPAWSPWCCCGWPGSGLKIVVPGFKGLKGGRYGAGQMLLLPE